MTKELERRNEMLEVAVLAIAGMPQTGIAKKLSISRSKVQTIQRKPEYKALFDDMVNETVGTAKGVIKHETAKLASEVMRVLITQLRDKDNLEAVKIALKVLGVDQLEEQEKGGTSINLVLPGQAVKTVVSDMKESS